MKTSEGRTGPRPPRMTAARRAELERFRHYNSSLDEALEELFHVEQERDLARDELGQITQSTTSSTREK